MSRFNRGFEAGKRAAAQRKPNKTNSKDQEYTRGFESGYACASVGQRVAKTFLSRSVDRR